MAAAGGSVQKSKYWLQKRLEETKSTRTDMLNAVQEKIDSIVSKPIEVATELMRNASASCQDLNSASLQLSNCSYFIWSLLINMCEIIENQESKASKMCIGFNEFSPSRELCIDSIPAISVNYVQIESHNERDTSCHSSEGCLVVDDATDVGKSTFNENGLYADNNDESKPGSTNGNMNVSTNGRSTTTGAYNKDNVPLSVSPTLRSEGTERHWNDSYTNNAILSDSDIVYDIDGTLGYKLSHKTSSETTKCESPLTELKCGNSVCSRTSQYHQLSQNGASGKSTDSFHNDQATVRKNSQRENKKYESDSKFSTSNQDSPVTNSRDSNSQEVHLSNESAENNIPIPTNQELSNCDQKIKSSAMMSDMTVQETEPTPVNHASGGENNARESDSYKSFESIYGSASKYTQSSQSIYHSDLEYGTETADQSCAGANLSFGTSQVSNDNLIVRNQCETVAYKSCSKPTARTIAIDASCSSKPASQSVPNDEFEFIGTVSDIATPYSFSIQRKSDSCDLVKLGQNLNTFYNNPNKVEEILHMKEAPKQGDCIAVKFIIDGSWYRGLVLQVIGLDTAIVRYIDYGNSDEILWRSAFKLPKVYQDVSPMSTRCSLAGIKPLQSGGSDDGTRVWDKHAMTWFDETLLDKTVNVIPVFKTSQLMYVQLFTGRETGSGSACISDVMVEIGIARYDVDEDEDVQVGSLPEYNLVTQPMQLTQANNSVSHNTNPERQITESDNVNGIDQGCVNLTSHITTTDKSSTIPKVKEIDRSTQDDLGVWNPLVEDYQSRNNSYGIDNENACVMVEGYDPEEIPVCKYYMKTQCWNGEKCPNLHQTASRSGETMVKLPTFSGSDIPPMELRVGDLCIARVTNIDRAQNFYIHVIKVLGNRDVCSKIDISLMDCTISAELNSLCDDMSRYCNRGTRPRRNGLRPEMGEVYIVYVMGYKSYHRGTVIESNDGLATIKHQPVAVHLIDLGKNTDVPERLVYSMSPAFMHLPKQSVHCMLWNANSGKHVLMEKLSKCVNRENFVMEVMEVCDVTSGPVAVNLYSVGSNGLEKFS